MKSILSLTVMETGVIVYFLGLNYTLGSVPPIGVTLAEQPADPLPQALTITTIIIGVAVTAVAVTMLMAIHRRHNTIDWHKMKLYRKEEDNTWNC